MDVNRIDMTPGMESDVHVKIWPVNSIRCTEKPEKLDPETEEEKEELKKSMTFRFETVNYPAETVFRCAWIVHKKDQNPYRIPVVPETAIECSMVEEREEDDGKRKIALWELTVTCDFLDIALIGRGKLSLEVDHNYEHGKELYIDYDFNYPVDLKFDLPPGETLPAGTKVKVRLKVHEIYQQCKFQLRISESLPGMIDDELERAARRFHWHPGKTELKREWYLGCRVAGRVITAMTWPKSGMSPEFGYKHRLTLFRKQGGHAVVHGWTDIMVPAQFGLGDLIPLSVRKPRVTEFSLEVLDITGEKEPFDAETDILITPDQDPKWKKFQLRPFVKIEELASGLFLPLLIEYRHYPRQKVHLKNVTESIGQVHRFYGNARSGATHFITQYIPSNNIKAQFLGLIHFPQDMLPDGERVPFFHVLTYDPEKWIPWGNSIRNMEVISHSDSDHENALFLGQRGYAQEMLPYNIGLEEEYFFNTPYTLVYGKDKERRNYGWVDGEGNIREELPDNVTEARLELTTVEGEKKTAQLILNDFDDGEKGIQERYRNLGLYPGEIDGDLGDMSKQATRSYQRKRGLRMDKISGPITQKDLKKESGR